MKFSVLVPVYNVEQYLKECIESILKQTYQDYELILVDDGSTDNSGMICDKYVEKCPEKIRVIHKENQGLISARRVAITEAKGEFCIFVDSDDFVERNLLEVIVEYLDRDADIDILMYSFSYYRNGKTAEQFRIIAKDGQVWEGEQKKDIYNRLITSSDITSLCTKAIRTDILKSDSTDYTPYYTKNMAEDLLQSLYPVVEANKIVYTERSLYNYRIIEESTSHQTSLDSIAKKNTIHVYKKIVEYLPVMKLDDEITKKKIAAKWFNDTMYIMSMYYENAIGKQKRKEIVDYDWEQMLPLEVRISRNEYENKNYQKLYNYVIKKKYLFIDSYFIKKKLYSVWKKRKKKRK